jgi:hypothetical protein
VQSGGAAVKSISCVSNLRCHAFLTLHSSILSFLPAQHVLPCTMSDSKSIYLISQNYGYVLAYQENGKPSPLIVGYAGDRGDAEKWIVEQGDEPNTVALKSALNGQYLTGEKTDRGKVSLREEKQWWIIDHDNKDIHSPGAYRLRLAESPKYWLFVSSSGSIRQGQQGWQ